LQGFLIIYPLNPVIPNISPQLAKKAYKICAKIVGAVGGIFCNNIFKQKLTSPHLCGELSEGFTIKLLNGDQSQLGEKLSKAQMSNSIKQGTSR
jgi:hypothetical protein